MTVATPTASRWTCDGCEVSVSWIGGRQAPLPESWTRSGEGQFCLKCRRERAADAAVDAAPETSTRDGRAKLRRASLIEFEVRRTPELPDNRIARACHASPIAVKAARQRLDAESTSAA
jgi:hypothetical protein